MADLMSGCRGGAVLHGPGVCRRAVLSADEMDALGLSRGPWCRPHGEALARVKDPKKATAAIVTTVTGKSSEERRQVDQDVRRRNVEDRRRDLADRIVAHVLAAESHPVSSKAVADALGVNVNTMKRAYEYVTDDRVVLKRGNHGGWHLAGDDRLAALTPQA